MDAELPAPDYQRGDVRLYLGDCREVLARFPDAFVATVITDPPYGLEFMGTGWDKGVPGVEFWDCFKRVCLPGAMLLSFGGTRTFHRLVCAIEDAGWEIRDTLMWLHGEGYPKSHDISKAIDKTAPATEAAKLWKGHGTALKPAYEPVTLAMKPRHGTFAKNALKHGVAGLNIDGGRVPSTSVLDESPVARWPSNVIHDGSPEVLEGMPETGLSSGGQCGAVGMHKMRGDIKPTWKGQPGFLDSGSAARFFYCAKASPAEREAFNTHPTVKPLALMRYLVKLTRTPTGGVVLDPFLGSGTTALACWHENRPCIGIEQDRESFEIACRRMDRIIEDQPLFAQ